MIELLFQRPLCNPLRLLDAPSIYYPIQKMGGVASNSPDGLARNIFNPTSITLFLCIQGAIC